MEDKYVDNTVITPAREAFAVTPNDSTDLAKVPKALYIGGAGDVECYFAGVATAVVFVGVPAGTILPIRPSRVLDANTTATSIVALY